MLSKLTGYFSVSQVGKNRAPEHSHPASDTTPLLSSTASPKKSTFRLSNDAGNNDPCAPPAQRFPLQCAKISREIESSFDTSAPQLADVSTIQAKGKDCHSALTRTEESFNKKAPRVGSRETKMEELLKGSKFESMIHKKTGGFLDSRTGLCCQLEIISDDPKTYALCIPGIAEGEMFGTQLSASVQQFLGVGGVPEIYSQALELAKFLNEKLKNNKGQPLELTGHSMGGGIANYVGLKLNLTSVCFNAAALGRACLKAIDKVSTEALNKQTHIRVENDFATHPPVTRKLLAFFSLGREKWVPRNVGVICEIKKGDQYYPHGQSMMGRHLLDSVRDWCHQLPLSKMS